MNKQGFHLPDNISNEFTILWKKYENAIKSKINLKIHPKFQDEVNDVFQEAWIYCSSRFHTYNKEKGSFYTWVTRLLDFVCMNYYNKNKKRIANDFQDMDDTKTITKHNKSYKELNDRTYQQIFSLWRLLPE